jgi:hypothetical protein
MPNSSPSNIEKKLTHIYVREAQTGYLRPCWAAGRKLYCGVCMKGILAPEIGQVCSICFSKIEHVLKITQ